MINVSMGIRYKIIQIGKNWDQVSRTGWTLPYYSIPMMNIGSEALTLGHGTGDHY